MHIVQCKLCRKPFHTVGRKFCTVCVEKIDQDYFKVRDYIYENKLAGIDEVSKETGVSKPIIVFLIEDGRLKFRDDSPLATVGGKKCRVCGKMIRGDSICEECKKSLVSTMQQSVEKNKSPELKEETGDKKKASARMHTGEFDKRK